MSRKIKAAIIDSGLYPYPELTSHCIGGIEVKKTEGKEIKITSDYTDVIGHGTAVADAFLKSAGEEAYIYCIKIYDNEIETDIDCMIKALKVVEEFKPEFDIVIISSGVTYIDRYNELESEIDALYRKGILIFSAFDNDGAMSWPAAFQNVIGTAMYQSKILHPHVIDKNEVNFYMPLHFYRLKWVNPGTIIISGSSFANAMVAGKCVKWMQENEKNTNIEYLLSYLAQEFHIKMEYGNTNSLMSWNRGKAFVKKIKKAVVFPWNKEMHALARFEECIPFQISGFYDTKYSFNIGRSVEEIEGNDKKSREIQNIDALDWNSDFDTVICGHCEELTQLTKKNYLQEILEKCKKYNKCLYALDREAETDAIAGLDYYIPQIIETDFNRYCDGKLFQRLTPVLGVFGTSSCQGKFTLQMYIRRTLEEMGYAVGNVFSEPTGYLLGGDGVFPYGYNANIQLNEMESIPVLNEMVWQATCYNTRDLVIVGGQSGSVPYAYHNTRQFNTYGYSFLTATNPDVFVLCVNLHDPIEYIKRSIKYLEAFDDSPVIALVVYPVLTESMTQIGLGYHKRAASEEELDAGKKKLEDEIGIPVFVLGKEMERLCENIVTYLSEE